MRLPIVRQLADKKGAASAGQSILPVVSGPLSQFANRLPSSLVMLSCEFVSRYLNIARELLHINIGHRHFCEGILTRPEPHVPEFTWLLRDWMSKKLAQPRTENNTTTSGKRLLFSDTWLSIVPLQLCIYNVSLGLEF